MVRKGGETGSPAPSTPAEPDCQGLHAPKQPGDATAWECLESRAALPGREADGKSSHPSLEGGGGASLSKVGGVTGWSKGSSLLSS